MTPQANTISEITKMLAVIEAQTQAIKRKLLGLKMSETKSRTAALCIPELDLEEYNYPDIHLIFFRKGPKRRFVGIYNPSLPSSNLVSLKRPINISFHKADAYDILLYLSLFAVVDDRPHPARGWIDSGKLAEVYYADEMAYDEVDSVISTKMRKILREAFMQHKIDIKPTLLIERGRVDTADRSETKSSGYRVSVPPQNILIQESVTSFGICSEPKGKKAEEVAKKRKEEFSRLWKMYANLHE